MMRRAIQQVVVGSAYTDQRPRGQRLLETCRSAYGDEGLAAGQKIRCLGALLWRGEVVTATQHASLAGEDDVNLGERPV